MAEANKLAYPVALDPLGRLAETFGQVRLVPNSFLIGPDGHIVMHQLGRIDVRNFREKVERLLEEA
jgi:peroxiredoxin